MTFEKTQVPDWLATPPEPLETRPYVTVTRDTGEQTTHALDKGMLTIGRQPDCEIPVASATVSRRHALVFLNGRDVMISDLGSTNGTLVSGERIAAPTVLRARDIVQIGSARLMVSWHTPAELEALADLSRDLDRASKYVASLMPKRISGTAVDVDWVFQPSAKLGGDIFGYHALDDRSGACYLVDVTGHGVGAAMHGTSIFSTLRREALPDTDFHDPAEVLTRLNSVFQMDDHDGFCFTIWYGVYEADSRRLRYASAGHHPAYVVPEDRSALQPLSVRNPIMGILPDHRFRAGEITLPPDCHLHLFSDGVFEVEDRSKRQLALNDFLPLLTAPRHPGKGEPQRLFDAVNDIRQPGPWADDCSIMTVSFK